MKKILVMLGPPGSGKGTQSKILSNKLGVPSLSTGDILRDVMADKQNSLASEITAIVNSGDLISDELMTEILLQRLSHSDCKDGVILDGYPRNISQANSLEKIKHKLGVQECKVIYFEVSKEALVDRLSGRFMCKQCKVQYHKVHCKPKVDGVCDHCGSTIFEFRKDDTEDAIKYRLDVYEKQTSPLVDYYNRHGELISVDGEQDITAINIFILDALHYNIKYGAV